MSQEDRRRTIRIERKYYAHINVDGAGFGPPEVVQNLCSAGMAFIHDTELAPGTSLIAKINFPPSDIPVMVTGTVVRSQQEGKLYSTAIFFDQISDEHCELVDRFAKLWFPKK